jgi:lysophospholipase L1-like esterase
LAADALDNTVRWVGTWAASPAGLADTPSPFDDQTVRLIVHTSLGGNQVRVRISNTFGTTPLVIGAAHIALRDRGAAIVAATDRPLTFGGHALVVVPAAAVVLSDAANLAVPPQADLAVSLYLPKLTTETTTHPLSLQTSYVSPPGDFAGAIDLVGGTTIPRWPFLTGVDVAASTRAGAIIALGDSITDGASSTTDANRRWPNLLVKRLQSRPDLKHLAVLNQGVSGNRILHPTETQFGNLFGPAGLARFDRDVVAQPGAEYVIVLLGINDIGHPGASAPPEEAVSAADIIAGHRQFIVRAHQAGLRIFGATLTPFQETTLPGFYSPEKEVTRQAVNTWIRTSGEFDAVIDFDAALRDPAHPSRMLPAYDGGDHLHPSDAGMQALANAFPLHLLKPGKHR